MGEEPRPRANSWQIAGVWISAAALLIAAAKAAPDLWQLCRYGASGAARSGRCPRFHRARRRFPYCMIR
jgi:hypothetical protein